MKQTDASGGYVRKKLDRHGIVGRVEHGHTVTALAAEMDRAEAVYFAALKSGRKAA